MCACITRGLANISQGLEDCLYMGMQIRWEGTGVNEVGYWTKAPCDAASCGADFSLPRSTEVDPTQSMPPEVSVVRIDPRYFRPTGVETLLGDPSKAKQKPGWVPEITAQEMCAEMVAYDLQQAKQHALLKQHGYSVNVSDE